MPLILIQGSITRLIKRYQTTGRYLHFSYTSFFIGNLIERVNCLVNRLEKIALTKTVLIILVAAVPEWGGLFCWIHNICAKMMKISILWRHFISK